MTRITKSWKNFERRMATRFGSVREGATGDDGADFYTSEFSVQCKLRRDVPKWLVGAVQNAVANASEKRVGIALVKKNGRAMLDDDTLVVLRLVDFQRIKGGLRDE